MLEMVWVVLFVALTGAPLARGLPLRSTPQTYHHETSGESLVEAWGSRDGVYALLPALALVITTVGLLFGCAWCKRRKDCKLFAASATHLHDARRQAAPDPGLAEPVNNNISEDNNNGPISLREMQNIANNNAAAYIVSENEERNRVSRESVVEFEPLPSGIRAQDPLERCADWFGGEDFPRNRLQYLREIGRGWFGRVVEGEIEEDGATATVAVKILNQNASLEDKARFLDEAKLYRDVRHENILAFIDKCLQEDPWLLMFELCPIDLHSYLVQNRPQLAALNDNGVPLQLMCDVTAALAHLHSRGYLYGNVSSHNVYVRAAGSPRAVLGSYAAGDAAREFTAPETRRHPPLYTMASEVWSLGTLIWEVCAWGAPVPTQQPPPPDLPCPYRNHLYQVMQLCWHPSAESRPSCAQVLALLEHLHSTRAPDTGCEDFEERWQRLKPNTIPKIDEHVALVHAPSTSMASHFTNSEEFNPPPTQDTISTDIDTAVSRSSSIMSDKDPLSTQIKSESLTNLHGSLDDVRNIYLTHNETPLLECHQGNITLEDREKEQDRSDSSVDPWVKDLIAGSQDDVSYYKDVSDVIKNLDNILNSEKTSSSESSHQASPSRDNLSLDCKKDYPTQSSLVKSPGITNFQNVLEFGFDEQQEEPCNEDDEVDRDTVGTLSHSYERHSDTTSQHTLENLTPDTPIRDMDIVSKIEGQIEDKRSDEANATREISCRDIELPKEKIVSSDKKLPKLKDLCVVSLSSVSDINEHLNIREDCETSCDSNLDEIVRTQVKPKSIDITVQNDQDKSSPIVEVIEKKILNETEATRQNDEKKVELNNVENIILPNVVNEIAVNFIENRVIQPALEIAAKMVQKDKDSAQKVLLHSNDCDRTDVLGLTSSEKLEDSAPTPPRKTPETVQIHDKVEDTQTTQNIDIQKAEKSRENYSVAPATELPPEEVQNVTQEESEEKQVEKAVEQTIDKVVTETQMNDSTAYMDLSNYIASENDNNSEIKQDSNVTKVIQSCLDQSDKDMNCSIVSNESTVYLDLPNYCNSTRMLENTQEFLHSERIASQIVEKDGIICASTPKGSECSADKTLEGSINVNENTDFSETKIPDEATVKVEHKFVTDVLSPFDSPTKSHPTDTYDENSSVVLGPFENCTSEYKGVKAEVDLPKEELLAFSLNFSEMNLETPSPLRDGNFLNEVPDIVPDDLQFDDLTVSDAKKMSTDNTDETDNTESGTTKHVSPSTPPNSPGIYLASTSQQKYLVDIDLEQPEPCLPVEPDSGLSSLQKDIDYNQLQLNQIELQITTKLAMAENENNMNIEYSGPLTVEGLVSDEDAVLRESDAMPEEFLAGNGGLVEEESGGFSLDEECVKALRNELELKLPLAQVAGIEPASEQSWGELPPPPELVLTYTGAPPALSPIAEETRHQLHAYENDAWNTSTRTDSSESYPEPCNDSTAEVTDLPTGAAASNEHSTYTILSKESMATYTVQKDIPTSKEATMSADSLNGSPYKKPTASPIDDTTYNVNEDEKVSNLERISQVSPFLMSPTTDTSAPESGDHATGVSSLSKTTLPTDAKHSKPSESLSKATSIDSWCSNDTLYNVEENFDDLAIDADAPAFENDKELAKSASTETLTRHGEDNQLSHSDSIIHDNKSDACDTFSPDSITAQDNYTYTKAKAELTGTTPSNFNDSTKNSAKDLAYGTLPSYSNCTTELVSGLDDPWKFQQPELVRRSPIADDVTFTPPRSTDNKESIVMDSPQIRTEPLKKEDSVDISCLQDENNSNLSEKSKGIHKNDRMPTATSTPLTEAVEDDNNVEVSRMKFPEDCESSESLLNIQDISPTSSDQLRCQDTELLLEAESRTLSSDSFAIQTNRTPTYSDFESSAVGKPQELNSKDKFSQIIESGTSLGNFRQFENSIRARPQDLSSVIDASLLFLTNERKANEVESNNESNSRQLQTGQPGQILEFMQTLATDSPLGTNLIECRHENPNITDNIVTDLVKEEIGQPHSIIITELPEELKSKEVNSNKTVKTNEVVKEVDHTYDSHTAGSPYRTQENYEKPENKVNDSEPRINGIANATELVRQSSIAGEVNFTPPRFTENKEAVLSDSPQITTEPAKKEDSVQITCLQDGNNVSETSTSNNKNDMMPTATSTPFTEAVVGDDNVEAIHMKLPEDSENSESLLNIQDISPASSERHRYSQDTGSLLEAESKTLSPNSFVIQPHRTPTYSDFESSVVAKPQELQSRDTFSLESGMSSGNFREFENSVRAHPQDLSSVTDANPFFLTNESKAYEGKSQKQESNSELLLTSQPSQTVQNVTVGSPVVTNLLESHHGVHDITDNMIVTDLVKQQTDQPHSIMITEVSKEFKNQEKPENKNNDTEFEINGISNAADFESSVVVTPQEHHSSNESSHNVESGMRSGSFRQFENSIRGRPQDLSSVNDANSLFLTIETKTNEVRSDKQSNSQPQPPSQPTQTVELIETLGAASTVVSNAIQSPLVIQKIIGNTIVTDLDEEETDQPHSIIITEVSQVPKDFKNKEVTSNKILKPKEAVEEISDEIFDSHTRINGIVNATEAITQNLEKMPETKVNDTKISNNSGKDLPNGCSVSQVTGLSKDITFNGDEQNYATVHFLNEHFEELCESNVDDSKDVTLPSPNLEETSAIEIESPEVKSDDKPHENSLEKVVDLVNGEKDRVTAVTEDFLQNEKKFCMLDSYLPLLSDIRFSGPATELMSTTFSQESPTDPASPECEQDSKPDTVADIVKEWDSDSESHTSNSSSGEFIWKQQKAAAPPSEPPAPPGPAGGAASDGSADSGSGSEGDEVEFVPSSWDCRAAPAKSSLRSLEQTPPTDSKKRVVFKRQKYHCVYEYPRELQDVETHSPAYLPDFSTYCEWDPSSAEEAELGYGQLYGAPMDMYQLRAGVAFGPDYDEDFFISSSARPFESLGIMSSSSQFFPGMHVKPQLLDRDDDDDFPPPPSPLVPTVTPALTTPDSGVEDITPLTPGTTEPDLTKLPDEVGLSWRPIDSASSSESVSPSSPGGEALGGLRHTRDKLKLDLPPSPHIPSSPRHNRVFNFILDKPKRHRIPEDRPPETPLVMTDDTPLVTTALPIQKDSEDVAPEPTFSTFGKCHANQKNVEPETSEQKIILTDEVEDAPEVKEESPVKVEAVKGEGTVLDSGDEDSGIESSSKATLERKSPNVS